MGKLYIGNYHCYIIRDSKNSCVFAVEICDFFPVRKEKIEKQKWGILKLLLCQQALKCRVECTDNIITTNIRDKCCLSNNRRFTLG